MVESKVISVRVSPYLEDLLNKKVKSCRWWKRNAFITTILENVLLYCEPDQLSLLLLHPRLYGKKIKITITEG